MMRRNILSRSHRRPASGITLLEILVAFALLVFSFVVLITTFQGAGKENTFTSEHYTAMFLAQKILEDINQRIVDNPHFFTQLIQDAEGDAAPVVEGASKYFRLLENTKNFNLLLPGEDEPIIKGDLYEQLKPFKAQVSTRFHNDPVTGQTMANLIWVNISITWASKEGYPKEYRITQLLQGTSDDFFKELPSATLSAEAQSALDKRGIAGLARILASDVSIFENAVPGQFALSDLVRESPGAQQDAVLDIARMVELIGGTFARDESISADVEPLEVERDKLRWVLQVSSKSASDRESCLKFLDYQKRIADLFQQKAVMHVNSLVLLKPILPRLAVIFANPECLGTRISMYFPTLMAILDSSSKMASLAAMGFGTAEKCYLTLVNPPIFSVLPRRKEPDLMRRVIDIQKIGVLKERKDGDAVKLLDSLSRNLDLFHQKFYGQHPNFTDFLEEEKKQASSLGKFRETYSGINEVFKFLNELSGQATQIEKSVPAPYNGK